MPDDSIPSRTTFLHRSGRSLTFALRPDQQAEQFQQVLLPKIPWSLAQWACAAALRHHRRRRACLAFALLLDPGTRRWSATLPTQTCGSRTVTWHAAAEDYAELPERFVLLGSFQTTTTTSPWQAIELAPAYDGVHLIAEPTSTGAAFAFLRIQGEAALADPASVMSDDIADLFTRHSDRLKFRT